ncbi:MAG: hypothetical protein QM784_09110 [Polyangiaceae bacterium]
MKQLEALRIVGGVAPIYLVLMLLLGSGFAEDPRYAWAKEILSNGSRPTVALERLEERARRTLESAFSVMKTIDLLQGV